MYQIDNPTAASTQPAPTTPGTPGFFTDGSVGGGDAATIVPAEWLNAVMMELVNVVQAGGLSLNKSTFTQVRDAIKVMAPTTGRWLNTQVFSNSGTYTPTAGTTRIKVKVMGAGGAGGGTPATTSAQVAVAGAGGAGGYAESVITSGFSGAVVTIGAAGIGASNAVGGNGGSSSFGALVSCGGGSGGAVGTVTTTSVGSSSGPGGVSAGGNILNQTGWIGTPGYICIISGIGGGVTPIGAQTIFGSVAPGGSPNGYGSGGTGAAAFPSSAAKAGGNGSPGLVIVEEYA